MLIGRLVIILLFGFMVLQAAAHDCLQWKNADIIGVARHPESQELLYCEYHFLNKTNKLISESVEYFDINQQQIAIKSIDYSNSITAPNINQTDFRHNEKVFVEIGEDGSALVVKYQKPKSDQLQEKRLSVLNPVVDAGFDHAIREDWEKIESQGFIFLNFVAAGKLRKITLKVRSASQSRCKNLITGSFKWMDQKHRCLIVKPANALLNIVVSPIKLIYSVYTKELLVFSGPVNITSAQGKGQQAIITYHYFQ